MQYAQAFFRDLPNKLQLYDYDTRTDGQPVYFGYAPMGTSQSETGWVVFKYTYNVSNQVTMVESQGNAKWSIRDEYFT